MARHTMVTEFEGWLCFSKWEGSWFKDAEKHLYSYDPVTICPEEAVVGIDENAYHQQGPKGRFKITVGFEQTESVARKRTQED